MYADIDIINTIANHGIMVTATVLGGRCLYLLNTIPKHEEEYEELKSLRGMLKDSIALLPHVEKKYDKMLKTSFMIYTSVGASKLCMRDQEVREYYNHWEKFIPDIEKDVNNGGCSISHHWENFVQKTSYITPNQILPRYEEYIKKEKNEYQELTLALSLIGPLAQGLGGIIA